MRVVLAADAEPAVGAVAPREAAQPDTKTNEQTCAVRHGNATQRICHAQVAAAGAAWLRPPPRCRRPPSGGTTGTRRTNVRSARAAHGGGASSGLSMASWLGVGGMGRGGGGGRPRTGGHRRRRRPCGSGRKRRSRPCCARPCRAPSRAPCRLPRSECGCPTLQRCNAVCCTAASVDGARCTLQRCGARCNGVVHVATLRDVYCTLHAALPFAALPRAPPAQRSQRACAVASACSTSEHNSRGATPHRHAACRVVASLNRG